MNRMATYRGIWRAFAVLAVFPLTAVLTAPCAPAFPQALDRAVVPPPPPALEPPADAIEELRARDLLIPVEGIERSQLQDDFQDPRSGNRSHQALDILAPRGQPVLAVEDGVIVRLSNGARSGLAIHQWGPKKRYIYFYAHLQAHAEGLQKGDPVRRGQILGYVGTTGNAPPDTPHLHFAIRRVPEPRTWWRGEMINPYPVLRCRPRQTISPEAASCW
jgi:murein DD-endopeptidase MepM/ murein hydrolase activator NlpD